MMRSIWRRLLVASLPMMAVVIAFAWVSSGEDGTGADSSPTSPRDKLVSVERAHLAP